jgi:hypothetical protein
MALRNFEEPTFSLIDTPRTKWSRRDSAHRSTSSTPPPGLENHNQARLNRPPDASGTAGNQGVKFNRRRGRQFSTGADKYFRLGRAGSARASSWTLMSRGGRTVISRHAARLAGLILQP